MSDAFHEGRAARLAAMAVMVLEAKSARLRAIVEARDRLKAAREGLERPLPEGTDLASARAALAYEGWAAARRAGIDAALSRCEQDWLAQLAEARRAFGRRQVLAAIAERPPGRPAPRTGAE